MYEQSIPRKIIFPGMKISINYNIIQVKIGFEIFKLITVIRTLNAQPTLLHNSKYMIRYNKINRCCEILSNRKRIKIFM